jgi:hypothetical protein
MGRQTGPSEVHGDGRFLLHRRDFIPAYLKAHEAGLLPEKVEEAMSHLGPPSTSEPLISPHSAEAAPMIALTSLKAKLEEIATTAAVAAEALDAGRVNFLAPEVARLVGTLDILAGPLGDVCNRLAVEVDPQGSPNGPCSSPTVRGSSTFTGRPARPAQTGGALDCPHRQRGQTGMDRAALDLALEMKLSCGGWEVVACRWCRCASSREKRAAVPF